MKVSLRDHIGSRLAQLASLVGTPEWRNRVADESEYGLCAAASPEQFDQLRVVVPRDEGRDAVAWALVRMALLLATPRYRKLAIGARIIGHSAMLADWRDNS